MNNMEEKMNTNTMIKKRRKRTKKEENIEEINITVDESNKNKLK